MKNLDFGHKCNCNGKELRKTHYILGKDGNKILFNTLKIIIINRLGSIISIQT